MNNSQRIWSALQDSGVSTVSYLPCNKLNALMKHKPEDLEVLEITKESGGLALCFGAALGGQPSAMMIQNTGLGNLITELYTMQKLYESGLPIFVSWRGHYQEPIEAQIIFGNKVEDLLNAIDVEYKVLETGEDLADINQQVADCYSQNKVKVFLLSPQLWEQNSPDYHVFGAPKIMPVQVQVEGYQGQPSVTRYGAIEHVMSVVAAQDVVISQIGFPSKELYNVSDREANFYMLGALGSAVQVGIGLARAVPSRHVYVIDGDGSMYFNPNQLMDLATMAPDNMTLICLDNGSWGSTGNQPTLSAQGYNISAMVAGLGIDSRIMSDQFNDLRKALQDKVKFIHYFINAGNDKSGIEIPYKAVAIKQRFMKSIGTGS